MCVCVCVCVCVCGGHFIYLHVYYAVVALASGGVGFLGGVHYTIIVI